MYLCRGKPLEGVTLLVPDLKGEQRRRAEREGVRAYDLDADYRASARVYLATAKRARRLGATIIRVPYGEEVPYSSIATSQTTFVVRGSAPDLKASFAVPANNQES